MRPLSCPAKSALGGRSGVPHTIVKLPGLKARASLDAAAEPRTEGNSTASPASLPSGAWASLGILLVLLLPLSSGAQTFPDVPLDHPHAEHIEDLVSLGAIQGHPDGTFKPGDSINRAEFLKIAYRVAGIEPSSTASGCFPDVSGWYEQYVCDAAERRFVQGYNDGLFRPERTVSRAEGTKIALEVLGLSAPTLEEKDLLSLGFIDVSPYAWYARYLHRALSLEFYPAGFFSETHFRPDAPLVRGEAAAIINLVRERGYLAEMLDRETKEAHLIEETPGTEEGTSPQRKAGDDYGQQEAGIASLGSGIEGGLEKANDEDWFALDLTEGQSMQVSVNVLEGDPRIKCDAQLFQTDFRSGKSFERSAGGTRNQCMITIFEPQINRVIIAVSAGEKHSGNLYAVSVREVSALAPAPAPRTAYLPLLTGSSRLQEAYTFTLEKPSLIRVTVTLDRIQSGGVRCTLNRIDEQGFSYENYTGYREGHTCTLLVALPVGQHQVEISADASFVIRIEESSGDGNDGLREAKSLSTDTARTETLTPNDYHDWFTFTLPGAGTKTVELSSIADLSCVILPDAGIDLLGFSNPSCNVAQEFSAGKYHVGILRKNLASQQQSYSIRLR